MLHVGAVADVRDGKRNVAGHLIATSDRVR
jgi:hypothetical protein